MRRLVDSVAAGHSIEYEGSVIVVIEEHDRLRYLLEVGGGDVIFTRPQAFPFWKGAAPAARVVDVLDEENELGAGERLDLSVPGNGLVWALGVIVPGLTEMKARTIAAAPPKTAKHHLYEGYQDAVKLEQEVIQALSAMLSFDLLTPAAEGSSGREEVEQPFEYEIVDSEEVVERAVKALAKHFTVADRRPSGVDVEADVVGEKPNETQDILVGVGVAFGDQCFYAPVSYEPWAKFLRIWLPNIPFVSHNAKYDQVMLEQHGFPTGKLVGDSMVAAYIAGEPEAALKKLIKNKYGHQMLTYEEVVGDRPVSEVPVEETAPYCCADAYFSLRYHNDFLADASPSQLKVYLEIDVPAVAVVSKMELAGIKFDVEEAKKELSQCTTMIDTLTEVIRQRAIASGFSLSPTLKTCLACRNGRKKKLICDLCDGTGKMELAPPPLNPLSNHQLKDWFHGKGEGSLGLPVQGLTDTGKPSLDALALLRLRQPPHSNLEASLVLSLRRQVKYRGYLSDWIVRAVKDPDHWIHSTFTTTVVSTGRFSSREPNLQQVKLDWRGLFTAAPGKTLVVADYNQLEVRIAAHQSQDPALLAAMRAPVGTPEADLHGQNVEKLFGVPMSKQGDRQDLRVSAKCFGPETKVLCADLTWCPITSLQVGEEIIGFDEKSNPGRTGRRLKKTTIVGKSIQTRPTVQLEFADGTVITTTSDHPFLTSYGSSPKNYWRWRTVDEGFTVGAKVFDVWKRDERREAGWMAGFMDGEGSVGQRARHGCWNVTVSQVAGVVAERAKFYLSQAGFRFGVSIKQTESHHKDQEVISVHGRVAEKFRFLGTVRPSRLVGKISNWAGSFGKMKARRVQLIKVSPGPTQLVFNLQTDTQTFFAEGFAVHNCYLFAAMYGGKADTLKQRLEAVALNNPELHIPLPTFKEVGQSLRVLHRTYPRYFAEYAGFVVYKAREEGGVFRTAYGRERTLLDLFSANKSEREAAEREGLNLTVQGTAADIMKIALAAVDKIPHGRILLTVHDEVVCEVDGELDSPRVIEYTKALESAMEIGQPLTVPLVVVAKPATNWREGHG